MASRGRGRRGRPWGTGQAPPAFDQPSDFDQQAFTEAVGIAVAAIAQACAIVNQGRSSDIQCLEAHHPSLGKEGGVDDMRGIQDMGAGIKRKGYQPSSSSRKKQKASDSQGLQSPRYPGQRRVRVASQDGQMVCYHCQQSGHMRRDCPQRQGSRGFGIVQSQSAAGQERTQFISPNPSMGQRGQSSSTSQTGHIGPDQSAGRGRAQGLQAESSGQARQMTCYHCRQPGHMRRVCPRRQRSHGAEAEHSD